MSDITNIKTLNQAGLSSNRNVNSRDSRGGDKAPDVQQASTARTDSVSLTNTATQLQSLQQKLADSPVVNSERVSELRAAIADGSYQVDAKELAQNMINFESNLG